MSRRERARDGYILLEKDGETELDRGRARGIEREKKGEGKRDKMTQEQKKVDIIGVLIMTLILTLANKISTNISF